MSDSLHAHQQALSHCTKCPEMIGPVITGQPVPSPVMMIGQAPGIHEGKFGQPFAWTAGKTLFKWFDQIGLDEQKFRSNVYMAAVCRCFPGKNPKGGDRVPSPLEIENCLSWLKQELQILQPELIIPVGKLAITQIMPVKTLKEVIGQKHKLEWHGHLVDVIPLPHPSGASTWHRTEPGISLLSQALNTIAAHPAWLALKASACQ